VQPIPQDWTWLDALSGPIDEDFVRAAEDQPATQFRTGSYMLTAWEDRRRRPPFCVAELS